MSKVFAAAIFILALVACASSSPSAKGPNAAPAPAPTASPTPATAGSLYDRLGKKPAITVVVDDFAANLLRDPVIKERFAVTDAPSFKALLVDQICEATGGPCKYKGRTMRDAHTGMRISEKEWTALVGDLKKALDKNQVPSREQTELITALGAMHEDVVNR
jgi:hemoglobin